MTLCHLLEFTAPRAVVQDTERTGRQTAKKRSFQNFLQPVACGRDRELILSYGIGVYGEHFYGEFARCFGMQGI